MTTTTDKRTTVIRTEIKVMHYPYLVVAVLISIALQLIDVEFTLADWGYEQFTILRLFLGITGMERLLPDCQVCLHHGEIQDNADR